MDSFAYRMSDNDDRRKPLGISDIYDLIALEAEKGNDLSLHDDFQIGLTNGHESSANHMLTERHASDKQTEANLDSMRLAQDNSDELENIYANTQIYANTTMLGTTDYANADCTIPVGRKPALPPKPSSQANTMKRNRSSITATLTPAERLTISHPNNGNAALKDPAEMSLKERLALFEQSTRTIRPIATATKIHTPSAPTTLPKKQPQHTVRSSDSATIAYATISNELSKMVRSMPKPTAAAGSPKFPLAHPKTPPPPVPSKKRPVPVTKVQPNSFELICAINDSRNRHLMKTNGVENHAEETKLICDQNAITALPASTKVERSQKPFGGRDGNEQQDASRQLLGEQTRKEEDRWDKFIECLLFFCCVG